MTDGASEFVERVKDFGESFGTILEGMESLKVELQELQRVAPGKKLAVRAKKLRQAAVNMTLAITRFRTELNALAAEVK